MQTREQPDGGSSPRLRGTPGWRVQQGHRPGIIPALAGNTMMPCWNAARIWDHPRACGEHSFAVPLPADDMGSSPRLRGTRAAHHLRSVPAGIIPALAGNTCTMYGDSVCSRGSSPRLRGTLGAGLLASDHDGIIPALAGNTYFLSRIAAASWDHPRACGEHLPVRHGTTPDVGSSPRLRGTRYEIPIIPTYQNEEKTVFLHFFSSWSQ